MCRLFGMLSPSEAAGAKWLVDDKCSLLAQSNYDGKRLQADGWGVAHFSNGSFRLLLSTGAAFKERERFKDASRSASGQAVLAHVRNASNPLKLPKEKLRVPENIQPFFAEGWAFAHNGCVNYPAQAAKSLGPYKKLIEGTNDSEVLFWHFMKALCEAEDVPGALRLMEERIAPCHPKGKEAYTALNVIATNGKEMHAYCKFTAQPRKSPKSICLGKQGTYNMCYAVDKGKAVVMSEMSNSGKGWKIMENGDIMVARIVKGKIETRLIG